MENTIAERLRNAPARGCFTMELSDAVTGERLVCSHNCIDCQNEAMELLADAVEKERTKTEHDGADVAALLKLADEIEPKDWLSTKESDYKKWALTIRNAVKGATPSKSTGLPESITWPTFEDGEPVSVFSEVLGIGSVYEISFTEQGYELLGGNWALTSNYGEPVKRPEHEVLDADGVKINVGDIVWGQDGKQWNVTGFNHKKEHCVIAESGDKTKGLRPEWLTHRKPDTQEAINVDALLSADEYCRVRGIENTPETLCKRDQMIFDLLARQRKLMGGE